MSPALLKWCALLMALLGTGCLSAALREPEAPDLKPLQLETMWVTFEATPWAEIYVDGELIGRTPILNHAVTAGRHSVRVVNKSLKIDFKVEKELLPTDFGNVVTLQYQLADRTAQRRPTSTAVAKE